MGDWLDVTCPFQAHTNFLPTENPSGVLNFVTTNDDDFTSVTFQAAGDDMRFGLFKSANFFYNPLRGETIGEENLALGAMSEPFGLQITDWQLANQSQGGSVDVQPAYNL